MRKRKKPPIRSMVIARRPRLRFGLRPGLQAALVVVIFALPASWTLYSWYRPAAANIRADSMMAEPVFGSTIPNAASPADPAPQGMVWIT